MSISFNGIMENVVTFKTQEDLSVGDVVRVSENDTVSKCVDGNTVDGVVASICNGVAGVQLSGFVRVNVSDALTLGYSHIEASGDNQVRNAVSGGRPCVVVACDADDGYADILL